jgi:hypothetical protein
VGNFIVANISHIEIIGMVHMCGRVVFLNVHVGVLIAAILMSVGVEAPVTSGFSEHTP